MSEAKRDKPGVIAPPPLVFLSFLAIGLVFDHYWHHTLLSREIRYPIAALLIVAGLVLALLGFSRFRRHGTSVSPHHATTALVTDGIYAYSRNPLYISQILFYLGVAVAANGLWTLILLIPLLLVIHYGVIAREEFYLERKFGDIYRGYKARVRRWF